MEGSVPPAERSYRMERDGKTWHIEFEDERLTIADRDSNALKGLAMLFESPHRHLEASVLDSEFL